MQSRLDPELLKAYLQTDYIVSDDPPMMLKIGEQSDDARILLASFDTDCGAFITAWNPGSTILNDEDNDENKNRISDRDVAWEHFLRIIILKFLSVHRR